MKSLSFKIYFEIGVLYDLFLNQQELIKKQTIQNTNFEINFETQRLHLENQFIKLKELANQTDTSFLGAVLAQERKQIKGLEHLEKRLLKAQKRVLVDILERTVNLQNELFPNNKLQERQGNFSEFYLEYGILFIDNLIDELKPLEQEFFVMKLGV